MFTPDAGAICEMLTYKTIELIVYLQSEDDLTGTRVQSSLPVNVYSGNIRAKVDIVEDPTVGNINTGSRDHIVEQLLPINKWGKVFNIEPIPARRFGTY